MEIPEPNKPYICLIGKEEVVWHQKTVLYNYVQMEYNNKDHKKHIL